MQIADLYIYSSMHVIMDIEKQDLYRNPKRTGMRISVLYAGVISRYAEWDHKAQVWDHGFSSVHLLQRKTRMGVT